MFASISRIERLDLSVSIYLVLTIIVPESYKRLYKNLRDSEFGCVPPAFQDTQDVYELVREKYPGLCDDSIRCRDVCGTDSDQPEWKHRIRTVQQDLARYDDSRVQRLSDGWYYGPKDIDVTPVPEDGLDFEVGAYYNRWELNDVYGGQRYGGISTPADYSVVFIFTGDSGENYGYEDEFLDDGTFLYTGEGTDGDMEMVDGNEAIRDHRSKNEDLHLFENTDHPWIVNYVGQFEHVDHKTDTLKDDNDEWRDAIRFRLEPVGGTDVEIESGAPSSLPMAELFEKGKESSPSGSGGTTSTNKQSYPRSEIVKEFALRDADGVCQGCEKDAPFLDESGEPFLEVHHLQRRSDGGADDPENVIALCPIGVRLSIRRAHEGFSYSFAE